MTCKVCGKESSKEFCFKCIADVGYNNYFLYVPYKNKSLEIPADIFSIWVPYKKPSKYIEITNKQFKDSIKFFKLLGEYEENK